MQNECVVSSFHEFVKELSLRRLESLLEIRTSYATSRSRSESH